MVGAPPPIKEDGGRGEIWWLGVGLKLALVKCAIANMDFFLCTLAVAAGFYQKQKCGSFLPDGYPAVPGRGRRPRA